jgi:hypothetical protein
MGVSKMTSYFLISLSIFVSLAVIASLVSQWLVLHRERARQKQTAHALQRDTFSPREVRADLLLFQDLYDRVHPLPYANISIESLARRFSEVSESIVNPQSRLDFYIQLAGLVSQLNDDHTEAVLPEQDLLRHKDLRIAPFKVRFLEGRCYISEAVQASHLIAAGVEVLSINGIPASAFIPELLRHAHGTGVEQKTYFAERNFQAVFPLLYGFVDEYLLEIRFPGASYIHTISLPAVEFSYGSDEPFVYKRLDADTLLFNFCEFSSYQKSFRRFLQEIFAEIHRYGIKTLIIDIRHNQGGITRLGDILLSYLTDQPVCQFHYSEVRASKEARDYFLGFIPGFLRWLPLQFIHPMLRKLWLVKNGHLAGIDFNESVPGVNSLRFDGKVFLLIGPGSMSSASLLAATVKTNGLGVLVGDKTGGNVTHFGNALSFRLPNTGLEVVIPCSINHGNGDGPVMPDYLVQDSEQDLINRREPALELVYQLARNSQP